MTSEVEAAVAALTGEPALAGLVRPGSIAVVWSADAERVLWATAEAVRVLGAAIEVGDRARPDVPGRDRLRQLAADTATSDTLLRDVVPMFADGAALPVVARRLPLSGGYALLTLIEPAVNVTTGQQVQLGDPDTEARLAAIRRGGMRRFIWTLDEAGRFASVSLPLTDVVGPESAGIVGRSWAEIEGRVVFDEHGSVARALRDRVTWSSQTVLWLVGGTDHVVPVDLAGMPIFGRGHAFEGFRGFGLCRVDEIRLRTQAEPFADREPGRGEADLEGSGEEEAETAVLLGEAAASVPASETAPWREVEATRFGALQVSIGAQLGGSRTTPLRAEPRVRATAEPAVYQEEAGDTPILSVSERGALREIARALGAKLEPDEADEDEARPTAEVVTLPTRGREADPVRILDRLPVGIVVLRGETPLFLNRFMLDLVGFDDLAQLVAHGGVQRLFAGRGDPSGGFSAPLSLVTKAGSRLSVEARLTTVEWGDLPASLMTVRPVAVAEPSAQSLELELRRRDTRLAELVATMDLAGTGVVSVDMAGRVLALNGPAERIFGYVQNEMAGEPATSLLAPESHPDAVAMLDALRDPAIDPTPREQEVVGRTRANASVPLLMRGGRIGAHDGAILSLVFSDLTSFKRTEADLNAARRAAENASIKQSEFLARVSHEIRTPLNAIVGFAEIMLEERFGPVGSERYRLYLKDIHDSGNHVVSLVNDLLDIAKVAAGKADLSFVSLDLNEVVGSSVGIMQPAAARDRIVVRTSFAPSLPRVVADERSIRQVALNIVANAIRFTEAGGQVIVSTGLTDRGDVALRIRDTGIGMSPDEISAAMEPFRQIAVARRGVGTGLGLPLSKALVEANHGLFSITSSKTDGTLIEVLFPSSRVLGE